MESEVQRVTAQLSPDTEKSKFLARLAMDVQDVPGEEPQKKSNGYTMPGPGGRLSHPPVASSAQPRLTLDHGTKNVPAAGQFMNQVFVS